MYTCFFVCIVAASAVLNSYQQAAQACENGWFGPECQYKCRCQQTCSPEGECPGQCDVGWFGYKCQYSLVTYTATTGQSQDDLTFPLNDNNENTCVAIGNQAIVITFINICYKPWIRLHTQDPDLLYSLKITLLDKQNQSAVLTSKERYIVQHEIVDIHILVENFFVRRMILEGEAIQRLCSLWILKGQNVATKQSVYYSTSDIVGIDTGLPQYPQATDEAITCNRNDDGVAGTTWQVVLKTPFLIKQVDFFVNDSIGGSRYFTIKKFDIYNALYNVYITPTGPSNNYYGSVSWYTTPTKAFTFSVTNSGTNTNQILLLCEVLAYSDCNEGTWGVQCQNTCNKSCPTTCRFDDGLCNDGCFGYSDPPRCAKACEAGTWGLNCTKKCSNHCFNSSCDRNTGVCDKGCLGYSNPPDCTLECETGFWGLNCINTCDRCVDFSCNGKTGWCDKGCVVANDPSYCMITCRPGTWGVNCSNTCSNHCFNSSCDSKIGLCDRGCLGYSDYPDCTLACTPGTWGVNCSNTCSNQCFNSSCNSKTGLCDRGCLGYSDYPDCTLACRPGTWGVNCSNTCSNHCFNSSCDSKIGLCDRGCLGYSDYPDCTLACSAGSWGVNCTGKCSDSCVELSCDSKTGFCKQGCIVIMNSEVISQQTIVTIAASATAVLVAIIICIIVLKLKGTICLKKIRTIPQPEVRPEENFASGGYVSINDNGEFNANYDRLAMPSTDDSSFG
ncbi:multiple epidermal growth factor-like domains protein 10 isoform X2 [Biomphalaria glabrata]|uniref:Multiple epidermal growth factor-like domains protein 10 isoform X2 n=1 Tax=Biomphalaria glabrata TaxID=6526 RepID=A0A9W3ACV9_BIOGL|nr:multiple epidermal growth factor-like domains protein 10 isoform X2 [Biomphalaria glabrata]